LISTQPRATAKHIFLQPSVPLDLAMRIRPLSSEGSRRSWWYCCARASTA